MAFYDVFNGDADGICALLQLRLAQPREATLVTGVKRDIDLLKQVQAGTDDHVTVLDISMDKNNNALQTLLDNGATVEYFDHHYAGNIPEHPNLCAHINTEAEICTGLLVNKHLQNAYLAWAVTAAFGDNLHTAANNAAANLNLGTAELDKLEELGTLLNYNGYGATLDDLYFAPDELFRQLLNYPDPFDFIENDKSFSLLKDGYASDLANARAIAASLLSERVATFEFPMQSWSRRVGGVYGNLLARENPDRAHALLSEIETGVFQVSVRAPINRREGADELCRAFPSGGGRQAAAGINRLPAAEVERFNQAFLTRYG